jgi:hypothetical protein
MADTLAAPVLASGVRIRPISILRTKENGYREMTTPTEAVWSASALVSLGFSLPRSSLSPSRHPAGIGAHIFLAAIDNVVLQQAARLQARRHLDVYPCATHVLSHSLKPAKDKLNPCC